jgi:replicative DNA helicase
MKELLDQAEKRIFEATHYRNVTGSITAKERAGDILELMMSRGPEHGITGVATGFDWIDHQTGGFQKSELVVIGARPSVGKTALALAMALNTAGGDTKSFKKTPVGFFSIEMTADQILLRALCMMGNVDSNKSRTGFFEEDEQARLTNAAVKLHGMELFINDSSQINIFELKAEARRWKDRGVGILFVDYLTLVNPGFRDDRREREVAFISAQLKALAKDLRIPVVVLSQLSRPQKGSEEREPHLSDLRESGAIEQDADTVIFIHKTKNDDQTYNHSLILAKQRNGPTGRCFINFVPKSTRFENYRPPRVEADQEQDERDRDRRPAGRP